MKNFSEKIYNQVDLKNELKELRVDKYILDKYSELINKIEFKNIDLKTSSGLIHLKMLAALFTRQVENNKTFLKNIIKQIELDEVLKIDISEYGSEDKSNNFTDLKIENIDLNIGTNRRVNKIDCFLKNGTNFSFTFSADLQSSSQEESNSFQEKLVFESPLADNNPVLQKYYGYFEKDFSGIINRFIAKEYLPGENINTYLNNLSPKELYEFINISSELGYSMAFLYNKDKGKLLSDLKLENIIYNYINPDDVEYACRVCDNSGVYNKKAEEKSVFQILAHLQSLLTIYNNKKRIAQESVLENQSNINQEELVEAYLDSFFQNLKSENLKIFKNNLLKIKQEIEEEIFEIDQDIKNYVLNYLNINY